LKKKFEDFPLRDLTMLTLEQQYRKCCPPRSLTPRTLPTRTPNKCA
jgi:hypothetical protein